MAHKLMSERPTYISYNKTPRYMLQNTFMLLRYKILHILIVVTAKLSGTKGHVTQPTGNLDDILSRLGTIRATPGLAFVIEKSLNFCGIEGWSRYRIYPGLHDKSTFDLMSILAVV